MNTIKGTIIQFVILGVAGIAIGLTANAVRARNSLDLTKDYFDRGLEHRKGRAIEDRPEADPNDGDETEPRAPKSATSAGDEEPESDLPPSEPTTEHPEHGYQEATFADVKEVFEDPSTASGGNVFIDARTEAAYGEGHIPGAFQLDHYRLGNYESDYIDEILQIIEGAEKVIAYCNGGDCEDSIFMCGDLIEWDVPYDKVYLYPGGYQEWKRNGMPIETGRGDEE